MSLQDDALALHRKLRGKIETIPKGELTPESLALLYTPGVGAASRQLAEHPEQDVELTMRGNTVAVVSDGSAVLGLGDIGPAGGYPVMEGKAYLFKKLAGVDAFPIMLDVHSADEIVAAVKAIAPTFGGINLEDIAAPKAYEIEERLQAELDIPVMHDDQHATAIVTLAGLLNAAKVVEKDIKQMKIVIVGAGSAGSALAKLLYAYEVPNVIVTDSKGIVSRDRDNLDPYKRKLVDITNPDNISGDMAVAIKGADAIIGLSAPGIFTAGHVKSMAPHPVVFALSNPVPEILPDEAREAGAAVTATGRSDFANQINNVLVFPGVFKGLLASGKPKVTDSIKLAAAEGIASLVQNPTPEEIIPSVFDERVVETVAKAVQEA